MEIKILDIIQQIRTPLLDKIMIGLSMLSNHGEIWIALGVILFIIQFVKNDKAKRYRNVRNVIGRNNEISIKKNDINFGLVILLAILFSFIIVNLGMKPFVARIRPYEINNGITLLIPMLKDFSFPSGHTSTGFAAATALFFYKKSLSIYAYILAVAIAFSRLYLYVHYPTDVLVSIFIGIACGIIAYYLTLVTVKKYREP